MVHESKGTDRDRPHKKKHYHWYKGLVVAGAREHGLPIEYIERLDAARSVPDLDAKRAAGNEKLLVRRS
jgi:hypothetical protein